MLRRQVVYLIPFCFIAVFLIQYQLNTWLTPLQSRQGEKWHHSWGRMSCKFLNQHQMVSLKVFPSEKKMWITAVHQREREREGGNQILFGVGKTLSQTNGSRDSWKRQHSFIPLLRYGSLQKFLGHVSGRTTGSCSPSVMANNKTHTGS